MSQLWFRISDFDTKTQGHNIQLRMSQTKKATTNWWGGTGAVSQSVSQSVCHWILNRVTVTLSHSLSFVLFCSLLSLLHLLSKHYVYNNSYSISIALLKRFEYRLSDYMLIVFYRISQAFWLNIICITYCCVVCVLWELAQALPFS